MSVLHTSVRALPARALALHLAAAAALPVASWRAVDDSAVLVLRAVAVVLACAVALAADEPDAPLLDSAPVGLARRLAARCAVCLALTLPVWWAAVVAATMAGADVPVLMLSLELAALLALGLALPLCLRRWWHVSEPSLVAGPLLLGGLLMAAQLPPELALLPSSPQDEAWWPAHLRWAAVLVAASALLALGSADPATAGRRRRPWTRSVSRAAPPSPRAPRARR